MDFSAFDTRKLDDYAARAKATWGATSAWQEFEARAAGRGPEDEQALSAALMELFAQFGAARPLPPEAPEVQTLVGKLQAFITEHFYTCTPDILASLGEMYVSGGWMTENIDQAGGAGTAGFVHRAIQIYCRQNPTR